MDLCKLAVLHEWQLPLQVLRGRIAHKHQIQTLYDLQEGKKILQNTGKYRSFLHDLHSPERDTAVQAFGEIFADFSSIAIARDALFEHCVRVCVKSNP